MRTLVLHAVGAEIDDLAQRSRCVWRPRRWSGRTTPSIRRRWPSRPPAWVALRLGEGRGARTVTSARIAAASSAPPRTSVMTSAAFVLGGDGVGTRGELVDAADQAVDERLAGPWHRRCSDRLISTFTRAVVAAARAASAAAATSLITLGLPSVAVPRRGRSTSPAAPTTSAGTAAAARRGGCCDRGGPATPSRAVDFGSW